MGRVNGRMHLTCQNRPLSPRQRVPSPFPFPILLIKLIYIQREDGKMLPSAFFFEVYPVILDDERADTLAWDGRGSYSIAGGMCPWRVCPSCSVRTELVGRPHSSR